MLFFFEILLFCGGSGGCGDGNGFDGNCDDGNGGDCVYGDSGDAYGDGHSDLHSQGGRWPIS